MALLVFIPTVGPLVALVWTAVQLPGHHGRSRWWTLPRKLAPQLLDQPGVGPLAAAQILISWSHRGRIRSEAAFARLAGSAPIPASSGQTIRYRLDRSGDRRLNRALQMILVTRRRAHAPTIAYINRRIQEGKSRRDASRCLKRYLARNLYRRLERGAPLAT